ncbi:hypothetical protein FRC08_013926 [Ceratobasidium sp. 394]|nr:hypothetical protein FRC08_013926 [Ceratobasidium sp. 394]
MVYTDIADSLPAPAPHLKHLAFHYVDYDTVYSAGKLGLLAGLNSLEIVFGDEPDFPDPPDNGSWELDLMNLIWRNGSELTKLSLDFGDETFSLPAASLLHPMAALPLKHVCLKGSMDVLHAQLGDIASIWPTVSRLELLNSYPLHDFNALRYLTNLPHLRHLVLKLDVDAEFLPPPSTPTLLALETLEVDDDSFEFGPDLSLAAQYILSLWPNLQEVRWSLLDEKKPLDSSELESKARVKTLKRLISLQHDVGRLRACIIERCGLGVLDRLFR